MQSDADSPATDGPSAPLPASSSSPTESRPVESAPRDRIRVLRVITWLPVGGIERKIVDVLPRLDRVRFEPRLVCLREPGPLAAELAAAGVPVDCIPFRRRWDLAALRRLAAYLREHRIDVVHSHMYRSNVPATVAARMAGVRGVLAQLHNVGTWESSRQLWMDRMLCRWRSGVIAVSEQVRTEAIERLRIAPDKVRTIYNGVDLRRFGGHPEQRERRRALRAEHGVGPEEVVFLLAARLVEQKRPQDFLSMARRLQEEEAEARRSPGSAAGRAPSRFWILGDGRMREELGRQAASLPDPSRVSFFGRRDDVDRFMAAADAFVMPSTKEGFSNALLEAMASGLAIVATRVGGNAEAVRDGKDGMIVPPLARERLEDAARRMVVEPDLRRHFAAAALERARMFSVERMVENLESLYAEVAGRGGESKETAEASEAADSEDAGAGATSGGASSAAGGAAPPTEPA